MRTKFLHITLILVACYFRNYAVITYGNSQTNGANGLCIGCSVSNAANATDGNTSTYSTANQTVGTVGAYVYQNIYFPSTAPSGSYVGVLVEADNLAALNASLLGSVELTTYNGGTSNNDTKSSVQFSINLMAGSTTKYYIEYQVTSDFDRVEFKLNAGVAGALNNFRIYYGYYNVSPLPLRLLSFISRESGKNQVEISWKSTLESGLWGYILERSKTGNDYEQIVFIKATNLIGLNEYVYADRPSSAGKFFYRLKAVELNGAEEVLQIQEVEIQNVQNIQVLYRDQNLVIRNLKSSDSYLTIEIWSLTSGSLINSSKQSAHAEEIQFSQELAKGLYMARGISEGKQVFLSSFSSF